MAGVTGPIYRVRTVQFVLGMRTLFPPEVGPLQGHTPCTVRSGGAAVTACAMYLTKRNLKRTSYTRGGSGAKGAWDAKGVEQKGARKTDGGAERRGDGGAGAPQ